jgi:hypothetical protein
VQFCADEINRLRGTVGQPALTRSESLERFAKDAAEHDATAGIPHLLFSKTNGGGVALAETELLHWKNSQVQAVIRQGLASMWTPGPGSEHYGILVGPYTQVGCGVFIDRNEITVAQDFR